ncbi:MAG TPA: orc1/cdc6 family replication initiation protein [archaeon]|nr:orc1/cdc6 family replication initiation protein [archaeon]
MDVLSPQANTVTSQLFSKYLESQPLFSNRTILSASFTPNRIPHREKQIADLGRIVAPALKGGKPSNVFIYGRTGTGKTLVAKMVLDELERASVQTSYKAKTFYINCKMKKVADTEYRVLSHLMSQFGKEVPFTGLPTDQLYSMFFKALDEEERTVILIVDEIDNLVERVGDEILYNITRANHELKKSRLSIIGITNNLAFIENLDPRVRSSLGEEELVFAPYNAVQLQEILKERAYIAFEVGAIADGVIEKCSALAAQEHGDARRALDLLRVAGELAERAGDRKIEIRHVDLAEERIDTDRVVEIVKAQPRQSQIVLWAIMKHIEGGRREIETSEIIDLYRELCKASGLRELTQRRVSDLIAELDMFGIISSRIVSHGRYGRTRVVSLPLSDSVHKRLKAALSQYF